MASCLISAYSRTVSIATRVKRPLMRGVRGQEEKGLKTGTVLFNRKNCYIKNRFVLLSIK